jgi:choline-sulfatase
MPARASFVSGLYPHNHRLWTNAGRLPAHDETFFQHLQRSGYYTAYVGKSHFYPHGGKHLREYEDYMHARGLDYVHETTGPWATTRTDSYMTDHWREKGLLSAFREDYAKRRKTGPCAVWPSPLPTEEFLDSYIGRKAVEFIQSYNGDKPICLFVGFGGPHEPWDAPGEYATMYDPDEVPPAIPKSESREWVPEHAVERMERGVVKGMTERDVRRIRANYYGKISLIDHWIGEILDALEGRGWLDDTFMVFWSDHGEMLGDHGRLHKSVFYESSVHVPLILRCPGKIEDGRISDALVEIIDVYPTLLEVAGAEPSRRCFGRSLWPILNGEKTSHRDAVFSEIFRAGHYSVMIRTERYKYAMDDTGDGYLLFDLQTDPEERNNLVGHPDMRGIERELREDILRFWIEKQTRYVAGEKEIWT